MTDNEVLARWQGWKPRKDKTGLWLNPANQVKSYAQLPDYPSDDAAAMSLLDTLEALPEKSAAAVPMTVQRAWVR